jgi:hypothetical protein
VCGRWAVHLRSLERRVSALVDIMAVHFNK